MPFFCPLFPSQEHDDIIYSLALYIIMTKRVMISIPDAQWEYLHKHPEIRLSGLVQQTVNKIMVEGERDGV